MNVWMCIRLAGILAILFSPACTSLDQGVQQSSHKSSVGQRVDRFIGSLTKTVSDVTSDVVPIFTAATTEIIHEVKSDLPKVAEELHAQMSSITSVRCSHESGH